MNKVSFTVFAAVSAIFAVSAQAQTLANRPAEAFIWDLADTYPTDREWEAERGAIDAGLTLVSQLKARTPTTARELAVVRDAVSDVRKRAGRMAKVGLLQEAVDTRSDRARKRDEEGRAAELRVEREVAFVDPLLRSIGRSTLEQWLRIEPLLAPHRRRILRTLRLAAFAPPPGLETVPARLGRIGSVAADAYAEAMDVDLAWPAAPGAEQGRLDTSTYRKLIRSPDSNIRGEAAERFLGHLGGYRDLFGLLLSRRIEADLAVARLRNLDDTTDNLLTVNDGFEPGSYRAMFAAARESRPAIAKAVEALRRLHGLDRFRLVDLFAPAPETQRTYQAGETLETVLHTLAPLGEDYRRLLRRRIDSGWMHLPPHPDKSPTVGVFWQVGGGHPHAILSYSGTLTNARTLSGSALLMMAYASVPERLAPDRREEDLPIFSNALWYLGWHVFDGALLADPATPTDERVAVLAAQLSSLLHTHVRNVATAELEARLSAMAANEQPVTGEAISSLYLTLLRDYFEGSGMEIGDHHGNEWMSLPTVFYGPHYASFAAAGAAAIALEQGFEDRDPRVLAIRDGIGRSETHFSADVLKEAGIDLSSPAAYRPAYQRMEEVAAQLLRAIEERAPQSR
jgi:oligoendopeptidase F